MVFSGSWAPLSSKFGTHPLWLLLAEVVDVVPVVRFHRGLGLHHHASQLAPSVAAEDRHARPGNPRGRPPGSRTDGGCKRRKQHVDVVFWFLKGTLLMFGVALGDQTTENVAGGLR